jgi:hypothetical protein
MSDKCELYRGLIPRILLHDLPADVQEKVEAHLRECESCQTEQAAYLQTLRTLQTVEDVEVPRHFLVEEPAPRPALADLLKGLALPWKLAAAGTTLGVLVFLWIAASGLQFRADNGVYAFSFGQPLPDLTRHDESAELQAVRSELTEFVTAAIQTEREQYLALLKTEIERSSRELNAEQKRLLRVAVTGIEERTNQSIAMTRELLENQAAVSMETLYDSLQDQRKQDLTQIRNSMVRSAIQNEVKELQTQVVLNTLLEATDLRLRGNN